MQPHIKIYDMLIHSVEMIRIGYQYNESTSLISGLSRIQHLILQAIGDQEPDVQKQILQSCLDHTVIRDLPDATLDQLWDVLLASYCDTDTTAGIPLSLPPKPEESEE